MALIACKECKAQISKTAKTCPQCGAKVPKKVSLLFTTFILVIAGVVFSAFNRGTEMKASATAKLEAKAASWSYQSKNDPMTSKPTRSASLNSTASLALQPPYAGANFAQLDVRKVSGKSDEVIFSIEKGQTLCKSYTADCNIMVRFDDAQPIAFAGQGPSDGSSTHVFLSPASKFIAEAKKAKRIKVSLAIYNNGTQVVDFSTAAGLAW